MYEFVGFVTAEQAYSIFVCHLSRCSLLFLFVNLFAFLFLPLLVYFELSRHGLKVLKSSFSVCVVLFFLGFAIFAVGVFFEGVFFLIGELVIFLYSSFFVISSSFSNLRWLFSRFNAAISSCALFNSSVSLSIVCFRRLTSTLSIVSSYDNIFGKLVLVSSSVRSELSLVMVALHMAIWIGVFVYLTKQRQCVDGVFGKTIAFLPI